MNAQAILQKIEDDAQSAALNAQKEAEREANELKEASERQMLAMRDDTVKRAQAEGEAQTDRMRRMAELDMRKLLLAKKREVIDEAFAAAGDELCRQPAQETRAFMLAAVEKAARGSESLLVGANHDAWFDDAFVEEVNQKTGGKLTLAPGRREGVTGAVLLDGGTEVHITYESLLKNARNHLETEIASILFNE